MKKISEKSVSKKILSILCILGAIVVLMCLLNISALGNIAGFNQELAQNLKDYKMAYENNNADDILQVEKEIAYTVEHSNIRINGTYIFNIILVSVSCLFIAITYRILNKIIAKPIQSINDKIKFVTDGDLTTQFETREANNINNEDEVVLMQNNMNGMVERLKAIISNVIDISRNVSNSMDKLTENAEFISGATSDMAFAILEVSNGAVSTAEDIQCATNIVSDIEENIGGIKENTENLSSAANNMNDTKNDVVNIMNEFMQINDSIEQCTNDVNNQIDITSKNVKEIQKFIQVIKHISDETNLLSLNAQIEACHSGEAGKGFAVVANKIGDLAKQSAKSSEEIEETLNNLLDNYALIIEKMNAANNNISRQNTKFIEANENINILDKDINITVDKINDINIMIEELNQMRKGLVDIVSSLSASSEENAAASEQANASIHELTTTITRMCDSIKEVKDESNVLFENVCVFKIGNDSNKTK